VGVFGGRVETALGGILGDRLLERDGDFEDCGRNARVWRR
jgi:hypothetical protein